MGAEALDGNRCQSAPLEASMFWRRSQELPAVYGLAPFLGPTL